MRFITVVDSRRLRFLMSLLSRRWLVSSNRLPGTAPGRRLPMSRSTSEDNLWIQISLNPLVLSPAKGFECQGPGTSRQTAFLLSNWLSVAYSPLALYSCSGTTHTKHARSCVCSFGHVTVRGRHAHWQKGPGIKLTRLSEPEEPRYI